MPLGRAILSALEQVNVQTNEPVSFNCIWVGLSGGVDSTVLLHALVHALSTLPGSEKTEKTKKIAAKKVTIKAIHVHHGLSNNADHWANQAQLFCSQLAAKNSDTVSIEFIVEGVDLIGACADGIEQAARNARYQVFEKHCQAGDVLLQGHHLDDQIETFFMRAIRGSGLTGLSGIPQQRNLSRSNSCQILRPFLTIEKKQLIDYATTHNLNWVEDESNQDSNFDRNWWRNELLPKIWQRYPKHKQALLRTIKTIQHEQNLLQQLLIEKVILGNEDDLNLSKENLSKENLAKNKIHPALNRIPRFHLQLLQNLDQATGISYLRAWLAQYVDILPSAIQMQNIYTDMVFVQQDGSPSIMWSSSTLHRYKNYVYLLSTPMDTSPSSQCCSNDDLHGDWSRGRNGNWNGEPLNYFTGHLSCETSTAEYGLSPGHYKIRNWQAGDVAKPLNRSTRKMKKWWQDYNVPCWARECWPIIVNQDTDEIAAVPGLFVCQGYGVAQGQSGWLLGYDFNVINAGRLK